ncbi:MAG: hypothetical protein AAGF67_18335, partial [Verrucomicrobiota bacterium]
VLSGSVAAEPLPEVALRSKLTSQFNRYQVKYRWVNEQTEGAVEYNKAIHAIQIANGRQVGELPEYPVGITQDFDGQIKRIGIRFRRTDTLRRGERLVNHMVGTDGNQFYSNAYGSSYLMIHSELMHENFLFPDIHKLFQRRFKEMANHLHDSISVKDLLSSNTASLEFADNGDSIVSILSAQMGYSFRVDLNEGTLLETQVFEMRPDGTRLIAHRMKFEKHREAPGSQFLMPGRITSEQFAKAPSVSGGPLKNFLIRKTKIDLHDYQFGSEVDDADLTIPLTDGLLVIDKATGAEYTHRE